MDPERNIREIVSELRNFEREGYELEAGRVGELIHALVGWLETGGYVPGNLDALWLETEGTDND